MRFIGIDPGVSGGIAVIDENGDVLRVSKMPDTEEDLLEELKHGICITATGRAHFATLEYVRSTPQMGVVSAFTFGRGYGALRMALTSLRIPYEEVTPPKWQKAIGCRTKGDKNVSKAKAQELFPNIKITHANADALLIAEYGRRVYLQRYGDL